MACQSFDRARNRFFLDLHGVLKRDAARVIRKRLEECSQYGIDSIEVVYGTPDFFDGSIASALHNVIASDSHVLSSRLPAEFLDVPEQYTQRVAKIVLPLKREPVTQPRDETMCFTPFPASRERDIWLRRICENPFFPLRESLTAAEAARFIGEGCTAHEIPHETVSMEQLEALCRAWQRPPGQEKAPQTQPSAAEPLPPPPEPTPRQRWERLWSEAAQSLATGDYTRAQIELQACMELSAEEPDSVLLARTLGALGDLDRLQNRNTTAESYYHSSLAAFDSVSRPCSDERLEVESRLVHALLGEGRLAEAVAVWRQERERLATQASPSAVQSIYVFSNEAALRARLDDLEGAAKLLGEAVFLAENSPTLPLIACASLRLHFGLLQAARGDLRGALTQLSKAAEELELSGAPEGYVGLCWREMAVTAAELGYRDRPEAILRDLIARTTGSDDAQERARTQLWKALGDVLFRQDRWSEAEACYLQGLETALRLHADMRREIFGFRQDLGSTYTHAGQHRQAEEQFHAALQLAAEVFPAHHPSLAHCKQNLAVLYIRTGSLEQARLLNEEALLALETFYNAPHPDTASAHHNYGLTLVGMQQWDEAERQLRAALAMYESIFGVLSPQLTRCLTSLGEVLVDRQRYTQARPVLQRAIDLMEAQRWNPMLQAEAYWALGQAQSGMGNAKAAAKSQQRADYRGWLARQRERKRQA
jgi:tetratricopeptide (TPR) repeat protein